LLIIGPETSCRRVVARRSRAKRKRVVRQEA
jgi:hypothetical protein